MKLNFLRIELSKTIDLKIMYEEENTEPEFLKRNKTNPFRTPDHYFDSIEDRVMGNIADQSQKKTSSANKVIRLLKPVLGLAASFALVALLVYYPINHLLLKNTVTSVTADSASSDILNSYSFILTSIDENSLVNTIFSDETNSSTAINQDEVLAYLSSGLNDVEIYSEILN